MSDNKRILVVDDDVDIVEQVSAALTADGYDVIAGTSQEEGEDLLLSHKPDLAILDLMMEQMDSGFMLCHQLKRLHPETPVIILTAVTATTGISFASADPESREWIKADLLLDKPVRTEFLRHQVRRLLHEAARVAET